MHAGHNALLRNGTQEWIVGFPRRAKRYDDDVWWTEGAAEARLFWWLLSLELWSWGLGLGFSECGDGVYTAEGSLDDKCAGSTATA